MLDPRVLVPLLIGVMLGAMFFGGLWWTVHRAMTSRRVALWFLPAWCCVPASRWVASTWPAATTGSAGWPPCSVLSWRASSSHA